MPRSMVQKKSQRQKRDIMKSKKDDISPVQGKKESSHLSSQERTVRGVSALLWKASSAFGRSRAEVCVALVALIIGQGPS